jgi:hypothetical protein
VLQQYPKENNQFRNELGTASSLAEF